MAGVAAAAVIAVAIPAGLGVLGQPPRPEQPPAAPTLYVYGFNYTGSDGGTVTPINTATGTPGPPIHVWRGHLGGSVGQIVVTPDGKTAYVTGPGTVTPIDTATNTPGTPIHIPGGYIRAIAITPDGKTAYVTTGSGTVTPISTATNTPGAPIPVGRGPVSIAITPDGKTAYVASQSGTVTPIDTATNTPGKPIHIGPVASSGVTLPSETVAITPDGRTAYVLNGSGTVTPIDTATNKPGTPIPPGEGACPRWRAVRHACSRGLFAGNFVISPDGKTAYATATAMSGCQAACPRPTVIVTPINTATDTPGTPIKFHVTARGPFGQLAITPDGKTAYVTTGETVTPINTATNTPGTPIHLAGLARHFGGFWGQIVITPDGKTAYVLTFGVLVIGGVESSVTPINTATNTPGKPIHVAGPPAQQIAITP
jgi:YVTN family beta-propeller protein